MADLPITKLMWLATLGIFDITVRGWLWECYKHDYSNGVAMEDSRCAQRIYFGEIALSLPFNPPKEEVNPNDLSFLFLGNSLSGYNHLDEMVLALFREQGGKGLNGHANTYNPPGEDFISHLDIANGKIGNYVWNGFGPTLKNWLKPDDEKKEDKDKKYWKWFIWQNSSLQPSYWDSPKSEKQEEFIQSAMAANTLNQKMATNFPDSNTLLMLTWAPKGPTSEAPDYEGYLVTQERINEGYRVYRATTSTRERPTYIAPVGLVYQAIYEDDVQAGILDPTNPASGGLFSKLYEDNFGHTTLMGSYIQALTVYASISGSDVRTITYQPPTDILPQDLVSMARERVQRTIDETAADGSVQYVWQ